MFRGDDNEDNPFSALPRRATAQMIAETKPGSNVTNEVAEEDLGGLRPSQASLNIPPVVGEPYDPDLTNVE